MTRLGKQIMAKFLILIGLISTLSLAETVTLSTHNLSPYGSWRFPPPHPEIANEDFNGYAYDVVECAFSHLPENLEVVVVSWTMAQGLAKNGHVDGFFAGSQKDSRDEFAVMSDIIAEQTWTWFYLHSNKINPNLENFKSNAVVSSFAGANMHKWLKDNLFQTGAPPPDTEKLLKMLLAGRIDAVLANNRVMADLLNQHPEAKKVAQLALREKPLAVYFTNNFIAQHSDFMPRFNAAVGLCYQK